MAVQEAGQTLQVTLYTKHGCHLCDDLRDELQTMQAELGFTITERDIELDPSDRAKFQHLIPVLEVSPTTLFYPPHDVDRVRQAIQDAVRARGAQS